MKKLLTALLSSVFIITSFAALSQSASAIGEELTIREGTPVIDGTIDKVWYKADRFLLKHSIDGSKKNIKSADSTACVSVLYDSEAIYFLFELSDDNFTFGVGGKYKNDCVNIYIDELDKYGKTWQEGQRQIQLTPSGDQPITIVHGKEPKYSQIGYKKDGNTYIIEYKYVPSDFVIAKDKTLLMDFSFCDIDENGGLEYLYTWSDEIGEIELDSTNWSYAEFGSNSGGSSYSSAAEAAKALGVTPITDIEFVDGGWGNPQEGPDNLWDGDVTTKYCSGDEHPWSVMRAGEKYYVTGVLMATANDTMEYPGRNPRDWKIEGSNNNRTWDVIVSGDEDFFENKNFTYYFTKVEPSEPYRYFRFSCLVGSSWTFQLSEVTICGVTSLDQIAEAEPEQIDMTPIPGGTIVEQFSADYRREHDGVQIEEVKPGTAVEEDKNDRTLEVSVIIIAALGIFVGLVIYCQSSVGKSGVKKNKA